MTDIVRRIAEQIREARSTRRVLRIQGSGTWLDAGGPVDARERIETKGLDRVIAYEPGDLTITVGAGTTLARIADLARENNQWLPLEPHGSLDGTIGATIATASYGPLTTAFGTPRDQVLGCEFVTGRGEIARGGGRVVKNVAGFDLVRLMTGAWGTLGVLTEVTMRLRAIPDVDATFAVATNALSAWTWLRSTDAAPFAAELISPSLAAHLGLEARETMLLRFGGNRALIETARNDAASLGELRAVDTAIWRALATAEPAGASVIRLSAIPSRLDNLWARVHPATEEANGFAHATLQKGVVRVILPRDSQTAVLSAIRGKSTCIAERLTVPAWRVVPSAMPNDALSQRVRLAFDPDHIMNEGILPG